MNPRVVTSRKCTFQFTDDVVLTYSPNDGVLVHNTEKPEGAVRVAETDIRTLMYWLKQVLDVEEKQRMNEKMRRLSNELKDAKTVIFDDQ